MVLLFNSATDAMEGIGLPGASLLLRDATPEEIQAALRAASTGLITFDQRVMRVIGDQFTTSPVTMDGQDPVLLTPREMDVLQGIARGMPNKSIARELGISDHTVKFHITSIFQKLDVSSRSEAIAVAARIGILDL